MALVFHVTMSLCLTDEIDVPADTTSNGTTVHTVTATDPENDDLVYSMDCAGCPFEMLKSKAISFVFNKLACMNHELHMLP